jgi:Acyl-CoA dehydrogenases
MDLNLTPEQRDLTEAMADLFGKRSGPDQVRACLHTQFDEQLWRHLTDVGLLSLALPEEHGGLGRALLDAALVCAEGGRRLACVPLAESIAAVRLLARLGPVAEPALAAALDGTVTVLAIRPAEDGVVARQPWGAAADAVVALDGEDLVLAPGRLPHPIDSLGFLGLGDRPVRPAEGRTVLASGDAAVAAFTTAQAEARVLTAAVLGGLAAQALQIACDYARQRHQFGVPIGSFQAVQQQLAGCCIDVEGTQLLTYETAWLMDQDAPDAETRALMAFLHAATVAVQTSERALHVHGGYGFTTEYDIHLYLRRAKGISVSQGDPQALWEQIGRSLVREA